MDKTKHPLPDNPSSVERGAVVECFFHLRGLDRHHEPSGNEVDHLIRHIVELETALAGECISANNMAEALEANKQTVYHLGYVIEKGRATDYELITRAGTLTHTALAAHEKRRAA